jgi:predicted transcriptional regulator
MSNGSFFKKVLSYLAEVNKGEDRKLIEGGWLSEEEASKISIILLRLGFIEKKGETYQITRKGLNVLLHQKMGKFSDLYDDNTLELLLNIQ